MLDQENGTLTDEIFGLWQLIDLLHTCITWKYTYLIYVYVIGEVDMSGGSVTTSPNLTGEMEPGMNTNI